MVAFSKVNAFVDELGKGTHVFGGTPDTLKLGLTNTDPTASGTTFSGLTTGGGYTSPGTTITITSWSQTSGVGKLVLADVTFTSSGSIGPFRYAVIHNNSKSDKIIGYYDYGSAVTLASTETFTVDFDPSLGALTIT
jgi:hypothetical protein